MFEIWLIWPPDDPHSSATSERVRLARVHREQLPDAIGRHMRDVEVLRAGLEVVRR